MSLFAVWYGGMAVVVALAGYRYSTVVRTGGCARVFSPAHARESECAMLSAVCCVAVCVVGAKHRCRTSRVPAFFLYVIVPNLDFSREIMSGKFHFSIYCALG